MPASSTTYLVAALPFDVRPGEVSANLDQALAGLDAAAAAGARLLALPEKWTTSFMTHFDDAVRAASDEALATMHAAAAKRDLIVVGSATGGTGEKPFNELHVIGAAGDHRPYRKRILFSPTHEERQNAAGSEPITVVDTPIGRITGVVCYDLRFPEVTRDAFYAEADLFVVPAQWPRPRHTIFDLLTRARAAENQCWAIACNRAGLVRRGNGSELDFPGTGLLADPVGAEVARSENGELMLGTVDLAWAAQVRKNVPCADDLRGAGL